MLSELGWITPGKICYEKHDFSFFSRQNAIFNLQVNGGQSHTETKTNKTNHKDQFSIHINSYCLTKISLTVHSL